MKLFVFRQTSWAQAQCCGLWLQFGGTIIGLWPNWWMDSRDARHSAADHPAPFRFGVKVWASDHYAGAYTVFSVETKNRRYAYKRAFAELSSGERAGWSVWRRKVSVA